MGKLKRLTVTTHDGQTHVFEGDKDEIETVREHLRRLDARLSLYVRLVNTHGKRVTIWAGTMREIR